MLRFEKKIIEWVQARLYLFVWIAVTVIGLYIRYGLRDLESPDYQSFYSYWYEVIKENGGFKGLGSQVGDYNMLYQFFVAIMTYLPIKALYAYKIQSCIFDFALAILAALMVRHLTTAEKRLSSLAAYTLVVLSPIVFLNSAGWAQCDVIYTFFVVASLYALMKDKPALTFILYGVALSLKLQAILFLPFLLFIWFARKSFTAMHFGWIPLTMVISAIPCLIRGGRNIRELYWVYTGQVGEYPVVHMNYPSFWAILNEEQYTQSWEAFKPMTMGITVAVLGLIMVLLLTYKVKLHNKNMLYIAFLLTYATVLFLPSMHERYGYIYEILAIIILIVNRRTAPLLVSLLYMTCSTYGHYLYHTTIHMNVLAVENVLTFFLYCHVLGKEMLAEGISGEGERESARIKEKIEEK